MESLYKSVDMEVLPDEYLPDDYNGPSAGPLQQIIRTYSHYSHSGLIMGRPKGGFVTGPTPSCLSVRHLP